ncbi:MAG: hypothetical protein HN396_04420 [Gemmatimonadales bacterium]|jgi:hypothetical protein|nr:hypothetical protein [Gemmatimonadales bacterium]
MMHFGELVGAGGEVVEATSGLTLTITETPYIVLRVEWAQGATTAGVELCCYDDDTSLWKATDVPLDNLRALARELGKDLPT